VRALPPSLQQVFAQILDTDTVDEETTVRISAILQKLQQPPYAEISAGAYSSLPADQQAKIAAASSK